MLQELGVDYGSSISLYYDNKVAIESTHNLVQHDHTKHVEVDWHFIKKNFDKKIIQFLFVRLEDQLADVLTKAISWRVFHGAINKLGMINIYAPIKEGVLKFQL